MLLIVLYLVSRQQPGELRGYFFFGFMLKVLGGLGLAMIYLYYYRRGDTFFYFHSAQILNSAISESITDWFKLMGGNSRDPSLYGYISRIGRFSTGPEFFMVRITAFLNLFSFGSYLGITIWFATFSFAGSWCMYRVLLRRYPDLKKVLAIAIFMIPSVVFWGSGLLKDSIILGSMGFILYGFELLIRRKWLGATLILLPAAWLMTHIRAFMLPALLLPVLVVLLLGYTLLVKNGLLRILATLSGLFAVVGGLFLFSQNFTEKLTDFAQEAAISANYLYRVSIRGDGSAYYLGKLDGSAESVINLAPAAVWVSLFRPYVWESNNVVMLLTAVESLALLVGFALVLARTRIIGLFSIVARDSFLQYALVFTLFFAFVTGITTFNFGSLARYRIPFLPFFVSALFIIWHQYGKKLSNK